MSLIDFIEKLQKKPRYIRVQIMWVTVTICMVVIFIFWLWSLQTEQAKIISGQTDQADLNNFNQIKKDIPSLWQSLGAGIESVFNSAKEDLQNQENADLVSPSPSAGANDMPEVLPLE